MLPKKVNLMANKLKNQLIFPESIYYDMAFHYVLNNTDRGVIFTNKFNEIMYVNDRFLQITGYSFDEIEGKTPKFMQSGIQSDSFYEEMKNDIEKRSKWKGKLWNRTKNGDIYLQELTIYAFKNKENEIENFIGFIRKLSGHERLSDANKLEGELYDKLTGLPNRILFEKRLHSTLQLMSRKETYVTLTFFHVKNFHKINSEYGLLFGNVLLKRIAERMDKEMPISSMVSRWEGTTFAYVTEGHRYKREIEKMVDQCTEMITAPYTINGIKIEIEISVGIVIHSKHEEKLTVSSLLGNAKKALLQAKKQNKLLCFYDETLGENGNFVVTESEIVRAIAEDEFELYYQPLVDTETNELVGFEALIRWNHPEEGLISPGEFIPLAEKTGLINDIGECVFKQACYQQVKWSELGYDDLFISVNLSMNQFKDDFLLHYITETIEKTGANPHRLSIELTESSFSEDTENTILKLRYLNEMGLTIAIDDFGTGYSSLGYLIDFPIDIIKIDRSFINVLEQNEKIEAIVKAINSMAKTLNIKVVAEGVETEAQYELVKDLECNLVQGFLFDRPQAVETIEKKWLN